MMPHATPRSLPATKELFILTIPQAGLMLCHLVIAMTDMWVAGKIDPLVQASLGIVSQIFILLMLITSLAGSGCLAAISQSLGAGLEKRAQRYAGLILGMAFLAGTTVALIVLPLLSPILIHINMTPELRPILKTFITAYCCQVPFYYALIMLNSMCRAYKLFFIPLTAIAVTAIGNFLGSVAFGLGAWGFPNYGYQGVAWATFGSTLLGLSCNLFFVIQKGIIRKPSFAPWRWNRRAMPYLFKVGGFSTLGNIAGHAGSLVILSMLSGLPGNSIPILAGMTLGNRVESFLLFPVAAFSLTFAVLSGHMIGAGKKLDLYKLGRSMGIKVTICLAGAAFLLHAVRIPIAEALSLDKDVISKAAHYLTFACCAAPLKTYSMIVAGVFAGAGATKLSCKVNCIMIWGIQIPLAFALRGRFQESGIYMALLASQIVSFVWYHFLFTGKTWIEYGMRQNKKQDKKSHNMWQS